MKNDDQRLDRIERTLREIKGLLVAVLTGEQILMALLDDLEAQVRANTDAEDSAILLIKNLAAQITAASGDPARIKALADSLRLSADKLGAAVVANTPGTPPTP